MIAVGKDMLWENSGLINPNNLVKRSEYIDWSPFLLIKVIFGCDISTV